MWHLCSSWGNKRGWYEEGIYGLGARVWSGEVWHLQISWCSSCMDHGGWWGLH